MTVHVSLDLDEAQKAELDRIARHENITFDALMTRLVEQRLEHERWFAAEVQKGIDDARAGRLIDHDKAVADIEAHMARSEAKRA
jgi:predicted transcriptional regulator